MLNLLLLILGVILIIFGVVDLLGGALLWGIILIIVGLLLAGYRTYGGGWGGRRVY